MKRRSFLGGLLGTIAAAFIPGCSKPQRPALTKPSPAKHTPNQVWASEHFDGSPWVEGFSDDLPVHTNCRCVLPIAEGQVDSIDRTYFSPYLDLTTGEMHSRIGGQDVTMREGEMVRLPNGSSMSWHSVGGRA